MSLILGGIFGATIAAFMLHSIFPKERSESVLILGACLGAIFYGTGLQPLRLENLLLISFKILIPIGLFELGVLLFAKKKSTFILNVCKPAICLLAMMLLGWV